MNYRFILIFFLLFIFSCNKSQTPIIEEKEEQISFDLEPNPGNTVASTLGSEFGFKIKILSKIPSSGVKAVLEVIKDSDGSSIDIASYDFNTTSFDLRISNLLNGTLYTIKVRVISKANSNNFLQKSFKLARK